MSHTRSEDVAEQATSPAPVVRAGLFSAMDQAEAPHPGGRPAGDGGRESDSWRAMPFAGHHEDADEQSTAGETAAKPRPGRVSPPFPVQ